MLANHNPIYRTQIELLQRSFTEWTLTMYCKTVRYAFAFQFIDQQQTLMNEQSNICYSIHTFNGVCKRHSNSCKRNIGHDMSESVTECDWGQQCQLLLVNWLANNLHDLVSNSHIMTLKIEDNNQLQIETNTYSTLGQTNRPRNKTVHHSNKEMNNRNKTVTGIKSTNQSCDQTVKKAQ